MLTPHWKNAADDLRARAQRVTTLGVPAASTPAIDARTAAKILSGIVSHVARTWSVDVMQAACAVLVRNEPTWDPARPALISLPHEGGAVPEPIKLIAVVAHGLMPIAGPGVVRDALSFWATEDDHAVWTRIVES